MALAFPTSPTTGDSFAYLTKNWSYNGEGWAAGSDVTSPTFVSATVSDGAASTIAVVFSEPLDQTQSATGLHSAFAVSAGHPLTASAWGADSRTLNLTTSSAFVNGEIVTLAFTQSGSVALQDIAGNKVATFSGGAITNNVGASAAGSLTINTITASPEDVTAAGYLDWWHTGSGSYTSNIRQKAGASFITHPPTVTNGTIAVNTLSPCTFIWTGTDAVDGGGNAIAAGSNDESIRIGPTDPAQPAKIEFAVAAGTATRKVRLLCGTYREDGISETALITFRASLSDSSASAIVSSTQGSTANFGGPNQVSREFTYSAATDGQTLTVSVELDANSGGELFLAGITYGT